MSAAEHPVLALISPAVTRAAEVMERYDIETLYVDQTYADEARAALAAALDVEEMARAIDSWAFRDHANASRHMQDHCAARRNVATLAAERIRAAILGGAA